MATREDKKKERERYLVRGFLDHAGIGYKVTGMRSVREGQTPGGLVISGPDVKVTCAQGNRARRVGVEVTEYQNDAGDTGSPGRRIDSIFWKIWPHLKRELAGDSDIRECFGSLCFDWSCPPRPRDAEAVALQITQFLRDHLADLTDGDWHFFRRRGRRPRLPGDFALYPLLREHFTELRVQLCANLTGPLLWQYNSAASVGVVRDIVVDLIEGKAAKLQSYDRSGTVETWLLICAGIGIPCDSAGPEYHGRDALSSLVIRCAAKKSGFDRVVVWDRINEWHVDLV